MYPHNITIFHKDYDRTTEKDIYIKQIVEGVYWYGSDSISQNGKGIVDSNSINVIIPKESMKEQIIAVKDDIVVLGVVDIEVTQMSNLKVYNDKIKILSIDNNIIGSPLDNILIKGA